MTQKLTLPLEVGKKYVRRDGKVVTARFSHEDKPPICLYVGEQEVAEYDPMGVQHAWKSSGVIHDESSPHPNDIVADYVGQPAAAHPHAEAMMEYAKDAAVMTKPWENWEVQYQESDTVGWHACTDHPAWRTEYKYRRKQPKVTINGIECVTGVKEPVSDELYYVASLTRSEYYLTLRYTGAHKSYAERGLVHRTKEDAIAMAKAMLNFQ